MIGYVNASSFGDIDVGNEIADDGSGSSSFGREFSFYGTDKMAVFDYSHDTPTSNVGRVNIFTKTGDDWAETDSFLTNTTDTATDCSSVAMFSDTEILIQCEHDTTYTSEEIRVYTKTAGHWSETQTLNVSAEFPTIQEFEVIDSYSQIKTDHVDIATIEILADPGRGFLVFKRDGGGNWAAHQSVITGGYRAVGMRMDPTNGIYLRWLASGTDTSKDLRSYKKNATGHFHHVTTYAPPDSVYNNAGKGDFAIDMAHGLVTVSTQADSVNARFYILNIDSDGVMTFNQSFTGTSPFDNSNAYAVEDNSWTMWSGIYSNEVVMTFSSDTNTMHSFEYVGSEWIPTSRRKITDSELVGTTTSSFGLYGTDQIFIEDASGDKLLIFKDMVFDKVTTFDEKGMKKLYPPLLTDNTESFHSNDQFGRHIDIDTDGNITVTAHFDDDGIIRIIDQNKDVIDGYYPGSVAELDNCGSYAAAKRGNKLFYSCDNDTDAGDTYFYQYDFDTQEVTQFDDVVCANTALFKRNGDYIVIFCDPQVDVGLYSMLTYHFDGTNWVFRSFDQTDDDTTIYSDSPNSADIGISEDGQYIVGGYANTLGRLRLYEWNGSNYVANGNNWFENPYKQVSGCFTGNEISVSSDFYIVSCPTDGSGWVVSVMIDNYVNDDLPAVYHPILPPEGVTDLGITNFGKSFAYENYRMVIAADYYLFTYQFNGTDWLYVNYYPSYTTTTTNYDQTVLSGDYFAYANLEVNGNTGVVYTGQETGFTDPFTTFPPTLGVPTPEPTTSPTASPTPPTPAPTNSPTPPPTPDAGQPVSTAQIKFFVKNDTNRISVMTDLAAEMDTRFPDTDGYEVKETFKSEEDGTVSYSLVGLVGNNTLLEEKIKEIRCGSAASDCVITIDYGRRLLMGRGRDLQENNVVIEITFDLSSDLLGTVNGLDLDDPTFEATLLEALGLDNTTDIAVTSNGGDITVTTTIETIPGDDPSGEELIDLTQEVSTNLTDITQALLDALEADETQILSTSVDLCSEGRDCNGRGTCDPDTGVCACVGDWWGINCELACECVNGGTCVNALCQCDFPYYGLRCNSTHTDCQVCTN